MYTYSIKTMELNVHFNVLACVHAFSVCFCTCCVCVYMVSKSLVWLGLGQWWFYQSATDWLESLMLAETLHQHFAVCKTGTFPTCLGNLSSGAAQTPIQTIVSNKQTQTPIHSGLTLPSKVQKSQICECLFASKRAGPFVKSQGGQNPNKRQYFIKLHLERGRYKMWSPFSDGLQSSLFGCG